MIKRTFVIAKGAVADALGVNQKGQQVIVSTPLCVGNELYRHIGDGKYVYTGTVTSVENAGITKFDHIRGLNLFIPHGSSPIDSHLEVGMVHSDAWKVSVDFIDPIEQIICICGVNVRLSKTMNP